jgi:hypothetical protein
VTAEPVESAGELLARSREEALPNHAEIHARVLFIAGWGRSGSTLLDRIVGQLTGVVSVGELREIWHRGVVENRLCGCGTPFLECPFWREVGETAFGGWENLDIAAVTRLRRRVDRPWNAVLLLAPWLAPPGRRRRVRAYAALQRQLCEGIFRVGGAAVVVDSSKIATQALLLRAAGVRLHVVHLVRDSRGVIYSWQKQVRRPDLQGRDYLLRYGAVTGSARYVAYNVLAHALSAVGLTPLRLRYEDLTVSPDAVLERVAAWAGVAVNREVRDRLREGRLELAANHTVDGNPMRFEVGEVRIRLDDTWRRQLRRRSRWAVGALTWPLLVKYGYAIRRRSGTGEAAT